MPDSTPPLALLVLTRDPTGRVSGRKTVLATAASSLERCGLRVEAVVLSREAPAATWEGRPVHHVRLPGLARTAVSAAGVVAGRRGTLNEALFDSPRVRRQTAELARRRGARLLVADGLRTTNPALAAGGPVLVHLDDLLSDRYAALAAAGGSADADLLGFFGEQLPRRLRPVARRAASRLVALEARRADVRERAVASEAAAVAMTSQDEADELHRRTGRAVSALPMAVGVREAGEPSAADPCSFVFLGVLDYAPNRDALRWWSTAVRPVLDRLGGQDVQLTVVGHGVVGHGVVGDSTAGLAVSDERVRFTGYVEDLGVELRRHRAMVAPVLSGAGVKTKVLDGWSVGLPVVATPAGAAGLDPAAGLLVAADAEAFARAVLRLRDDGALAGRTGAAGRDVLQRHWSPDALAGRWAAAVAPLLDPEPLSP